MALPVEREREQRSGECREQQVVLECLRAHLAHDAGVQRLVLLQLAGALDDVLDLEVVHRHAPLEEHHQQERVDRVAQVVGVPLLVLVHPQDAVADVAVLAEDVGERVVDVVVAVLPLLARADVVPLVHARVQARVAHPVVLAVHDVVADLHVVEDLGDAQRGDRERPGGREVHQRAAGDLELALLLDDAADVRRVLLAQVGDQALADGVHLVAERLELFGGELGVGAGGLVVVVVMVSSFRGKRIRGRRRSRPRAR